MEIIDIVIAVPVLWGIFKGYTKGLINELSQFAALVLGCILGSRLSYLLSGFLMETFGLGEKVVPVISFAIIFLAVLFGVYLLAKVLTNSAKKVSLGWLNTIGGMVLGGLKFLLILGILIQVIITNDIKGKFISQETRKESILLTPVLSITNFLSPYLKKALFETDLYGNNTSDEKSNP